MAVGDIVRSGHWESRWSVVVAEGVMHSPLSIVDGKVVGVTRPIGTWCHVRDLAPHEITDELREYEEAGRRVTAALREELGKSKTNGGGHGISADLRARILGQAEGRLGPELG